MSLTRKSKPVGGGSAPQSLPASGRPSSRARGGALALVAAAALAGCQRAPDPQPEQLSTEPLVIDEAMQRRDWPRVAAEFQAGGVEAGVTRFPYQPQTTGQSAGRAIFGNERSNALLDPVFFVVQSFALPFTYLFDPPFTKKTHRGVIYDPTYTAVPLLPPDEAPTEAGPQAQPAPEETAPVTPDAAEASELPPGEAPPEETGPLDIRPEEMPGEEGGRPDPSDDTEANPPDAPPETSPGEVLPGAPATDPAPGVEPMPEGAEPPPAVTDPALESTEPAPEPTDAAPGAPDATEISPDAADPTAEPVTDEMATEPALAEPPAPEGEDLNK